MHVLYLRNPNFYSRQTAVNPARTLSSGVTSGSSTVPWTRHVMARALENSYMTCCSPSATAAADIILSTNLLWVVRARWAS